MKIELKINPITSINDIIIGQYYYVPCLQFISLYDAIEVRSQNDLIDIIERNIVFENKEDAIILAKYLLKHIEDENNY